MRKTYDFSNLYKKFFRKHCEKSYTYTSRMPSKAMLFSTNISLVPKWTVQWVYIHNLKDSPLSFLGWASLLVGMDDINYRRSLLRIYYTFGKFFRNSFLSLLETWPLVLPKDTQQDWCRESDLAIQWHPIFAPGTKLSSNWSRIFSATWDDITRGFSMQSYSYRTDTSQEG